MKKQVFYAVVKKGGVKYYSELRCPTFEAQAPLFWNRKVAKAYLNERNADNQCEIKAVVLSDETLG